MVSSPPTPIPTPTLPTCVGALVERPCYWSRKSLKEKIVHKSDSLTANWEISAGSLPWIDSRAENPE